MFMNWKVLLVPMALAAMSSSLLAARTALPGTLNYVEGQVSINGQNVTTKDAGSAQMAPNQVVETGHGKTEMLLTPGVFLRVGDNSAVRMVSPNLADTSVELLHGEAAVEVTELFKENNIRVLMGGAFTTLTKDGFYTFNADQGKVRVFDGEAHVDKADQQIKLKKGHELALLQTPLKAEKFDRDASHDNLYAWSRLRSEYEAEASMDSARTVVVGGPGWYGPGWYWNPWWGMYGYLPGAGIAYSPFGWPFYSPVVVFRGGGFVHGGGHFVHGGGFVRSGGFVHSGGAVGRVGGGGFARGGGGFHGGGGGRR